MTHNLFNLENHDENSSKSDAGFLQPNIVFSLYCSS
ncbi:hypothetical protein Kpn2146_6016 [Klebsiella pneumoniae]|nr:hypothetical protein Kpn2146_6016 [Klebsiella pneumoniae]